VCWFCYSPSHTDTNQEWSNYPADPTQPNQDLIEPLLRPMWHPLAKQALTPQIKTIGIVEQAPTFKKKVKVKPQVIYQIKSIYK